MIYRNIVIFTVDDISFTFSWYRPALIHMCVCVCVRMYVCMCVCVRVCV